MTAKELKPGMKLKTSRWGICTIHRTYRAGKWIVVVVGDPHHIGITREVCKFPNTQVVVVHEGHDDN